MAGCPQSARNLAWWVWGSVTMMGGLLVVEELLVRTDF
jgi:hypothetical protein